MKIEVYCDESRHELLSSKPGTPGRHILIGSIWLPSGMRTSLKEEVRRVREAHGIWGEIKWKNVAPSSLSFFHEITDLLFSSSMRFRCIVVEREQVDLVNYQEADHELGFYKFYYQLLHHWIHDFNEYSIFLDAKENRRGDRLKTLHRVLAKSNLSASITRVQAVPSHESTFVQLADFFTGAVGYKYELLDSSAAKVSVVRRIESKIGRQIRVTNLGERKFNIFQIYLQGTW